tara:strand:+ start:4011 stop:4235 length:225 start_codon:yes stop_codon:yes gene_type:complete
MNRMSAEIIKDYINLDTSEEDLKKMATRDLMINLKHYRSKIGTEDNKSMISKIENEVLSRNLGDEFFNSKWKKI